MKISDEYCFDGRRRTISALGVTLPWPFPIWRDGGSGAMILGRPVFGGGDSRPKWLLPTYKFFRRFSNAKFWVKCRVHPRYRHHVVRTELEPGWHDCDEVMLYAMMALLKRYVEWEIGGSEKLRERVKDLRAHPDPNAPDGLNEACLSSEEEALAVYEWWTKDREAAEGAYTKMIRARYSAKRMRTEAAEAGAVKVVFTEEVADALATMAPKEALKEVPDDPHPGRKTWEVRQELDDKEEEMLARLLKIRRSLWT